MGLILRLVGGVQFGSSCACNGYGMYGLISNSFYLLMVENVIGPHRSMTSQSVI